MASLTCSHCSAVLKTKEPIPPGKKVKCPKCGKPFVVKAANDEDSEEPVRKPKRTAAEDDNGAPAKKGKDAKPKSNAMLFGLIGGGLLLCCCCTAVPGGGYYFRDKLGFGDAKKTDTAGKKDDKKADDTKPIFTGTALVMTKEFLDDENAAKAKYQDKVVEITGTIWVVNDKEKGSFTLIGAKKDAKDQLGVSLICEALPAEADKFAKLDKDKNVKVVGKVTRIIGIAVQLTGCTFEVLDSGKTGGLETPPSLSGEELAQGIDRDLEGLKTKYFNQDILVKAVVESVIKQNPKLTTVLLKTNSKVRIHANFDAPDRITATKGQTIEFRLRLESFTMQGSDFRIRAKLAGK